MRTRIYCNVAQGDQPLEIKWKKDGKLIESSNQIASVRTIDQFSVALVIENLSDAHNGNYTCVVANDAAVVSHTAELANRAELQLFGDRGQFRDVRLVGYLFVN